MFFRRLYVRLKGELLTFRNSRSDEGHGGEAFLTKRESLLGGKAADEPERRQERTSTGSELNERSEQAVEKHRRSEVAKTARDHNEAQVQPRPNPRTLG